MSRRPNSAFTVANSFSTCSGSLTSVGITRARPAFFMPAVSSSISLRRPHRATDQPSFISASADDRPMPVPEPVMTAKRSAMMFLPSRFLVMIALWTLVAERGRWCKRACGGFCMPRFAAIGLDHRHIYDLTQDLLDEGAECVGYNPDTTDQRVLAGFQKRFPHVPAAETARLLDDPTIDFVVIAARPCDRADLAIAAMRCGKDVMVDKPGITE